MERNCKNCMFWCGQENSDGTRQCRKNPPAVFPMQQQSPFGGQAQLGFISIWPNTRDYDFCGGYLGSNNQDHPSLAADQQQH